MISSSGERVFLLRNEEEEEGKEVEGSDGGGGEGKEIALALSFFPSLKARNKQEAISFFNGHRLHETS